MKLQEIILCICLLLLLCGCSKHKVNNSEFIDNNVDNKITNTIEMKNIKIPNGIYYDGRIYWEVIDKQESQLIGTKIGSLLECAKENDLPTNDFMGTNGLSPYIGIEIFQFDSGLYMKVDDKTHVFRFINQKVLGTEVKENPSDSDDGMPAPHVVYDNMTYIIHDELVSEFPKSFSNVGEILDTYFIAIKNFTGSIEKGSELYATDYQNRFILVKYKNKATYYVFENDNYRN